MPIIYAASMLQTPLVAFHTTQRENKNHYSILQCFAGSILFSSNSVSSVISCPIIIIPLIHSVIVPLDLCSSNTLDNVHLQVFLSTGD